MKNNLTELVFILDRSGSMHGLESDTIGGFNSMIKKQKELEGDAFVSTILFNDTVTVIHDRVPIEDVKYMSSNDYTVGGCTALLDAIGKSIHHISQIHKYSRKEDVPKHTMLIIITDGMENSSHIYDIDEIKKKISKEKEKHGWEFLFLGANIDAIPTAKSFGIGEDYIVDYCPDSDGIELNYNVLCEVIETVRSNKNLDKNWKNLIEEDFNNRNKNK